MGVGVWDLLLEGRSICSGGCDQGVARTPKWPEGPPTGGRRPPEAFFLLFFPTNSWVWIFFEVQDFFGRFFWIPHVFTRLPDFFQIFRIFLHIFKNRSTKKRENTWNFFCNWSKNGIYRVRALDELIIFAIHHNFPKRLFRAVEAMEPDLGPSQPLFLIQKFFFYSGSVENRWARSPWVARSKSIFRHEIGPFYT